MLVTANDKLRNETIKNYNKKLKEAATEGDKKKLE